MGAFTQIALLGAVLLRIGGSVTLSAMPQVGVPWLGLQQGRPVDCEIVGEVLWLGRFGQQQRDSLRQQFHVIRREGCVGRDAVAKQDRSTASPGKANLRPDDGGK